MVQEVFGGRRALEPVSPYVWPSATETSAFDLRMFANACVQCSLLRGPLHSNHHKCSFKLLYVMFNASVTRWRRMP